MKIYYSDQKLPTEVTKTIFLAGPTPRDSDTKTWRTEAIEILKKLNFNGEVFIPEPSTGKFLHEYTDQIEWELTAMKMADSIIFWVPRELKKMPALTTNVEFGYWINSGKVVFGFPENAEKIRYLEYLAKKHNVHCYNHLEEVVKESLINIGVGALRTGGEAFVPLFIWNLVSFKDWYEAQKSAGNLLISADLYYNFRVGKNKNIVFLWILGVNIFITKENRNKYNEFVLSRTSTSSVILYKKEKNILDSQIILVKEFRSPSSTADGFIHENAGGSSFNANKDMLTVASDEIFEETGFKFESDRFKYIQKRQLNGTLGAHKTTVYSIELKNEELEYFKQQKEKTFGNIEDTELTYCEVRSLQEILNEELVDWANVGMIMKVLIET
jgi:nucleoside 2-deoxyribosyltransferase